MSLLLASLGVVGGILLGRAMARGLFRTKERRTEGAHREDAEAPQEIAREPTAPAAHADSASDALSDFPCQLGDVVLARDGEEAWLAGGLVFRERLPMAVLFIAPDAGEGRAIFARPAPEPSLDWMVPLPAGSLPMGAEPPSTIEHEHERFERSRRLPYRVQRIGSGAPDVGDQVLVAEYSAAAGDRILVIAGGGTARAWRGRRLEPGMYDVLPSGKATLQDA